MARYGIKINSWDGGLNTKVSPEQGAPNESPALYNVDFDDIGAVETRHGRTFFDSLGTSQIGLLRGVTTDTYGSQLFAVCDGTCYYGSDPDATSDMDMAINGAGVFATNTQVFSEEQSNYMFMSDGASSMYKWDGSVVTSWSLPSPSQLPEPTHYAGGEASYPGDATYILTYENSLGTETLASAVRVADDTNGSPGDYGLQFVLTNPTSAQGVAYLNVYRKLSSASDGYYYRLTSQTYTGATDATIIDDFSDDLLLNPVYSVTVDPTPADTWDVFATHMGYMFASGSLHPTWLYYSDINEPTSWSGAQLIRIGDGDGYPIKAVAPLGNGLVIAKDNGYGEGSVWYLYTPDGNPVNWSATQMKMGYGSAARKALPKFARYRMLINKAGIYDLEEGSVGDILSNPLSFNIEPDIKALQDSALHNSVAVQHQNKVYISVPGAGHSTNNTMYVYDYVRGRQEVSKQSGAWSRWDECEFSDLTVFRGDLFAGDYNGYVYKLNVGYHDSGGTSETAISSYIQTMSIFGMPEHADNVKVWRHAWVTLETPGEWLVSVTYADDLYSSSGTTKTISVSPEASYWGVDSWGTGTWGRETLRKVFRLDLANMVSKKIQLKFSTAVADTYYKLYDMMLEYNLRGIR